MKKYLVSLLLVGSLFLDTGCALNQGARQLVVRSEQAQEFALATFDAFLVAERKWESLQENPTEYRKSSIHQYAEIVRRSGLSWINSVKSATRTYKALPNTTTQQVLSEAQAKLDSELHTVNVTLAAISTTK